jgi:catechol 2,3-dioxygenase-like lactoylglutathione lyase family enzyme
MTANTTPATSSNTVTVAGYSHVNLMVDDLDAAIAFYTEVMGFELLPRPDFGEFARGAWLGHGAAQIHLSVVDQRANRVFFTPHIALHIPAESFQETMTALRERGVTFIGEPSSRVDFVDEIWAAFIEDPCGNVIELTDVDPRPLDQRP